MWAVKKPGGAKYSEGASPAEALENAVLTFVDQSPKDAKRFVWEGMKQRGFTIGETRREAPTSPPLCSCGNVCAYYGPTGGYSVRCEDCNAHNASRQRRARRAVNGNGDAHGR